MMPLWRWLLLPIVATTHALGASYTVACNGYGLAKSGTAAADGCYQRVGLWSFNNTATAAVMHRSNGKWFIGEPGKPAYYMSTCDTSALPPAADGWISNHQQGGKDPSPTFAATPTFPLGSCEPIEPAPVGPHPSCSTPQCDAIWGPNGCPDLNAYPPDLVRPPMQTGVEPAAGRRVRAVAPGFEHTAAYHPLYLPSEWTNGDSSTEDAQREAKKYPVIVEYTGNGPWGDNVGDISTGRPEDSKLGWGMAEPAGTQYIWISMPFLSSDLGNQTEISTYWWGCPTSEAQQPCNGYFNITPTIAYLHSALNQAFEIYNGDPDRVVITGWSRGAIAVGAIGLYNDATSSLFRAFLPYSHLDGDCGWVDSMGSASSEAALEARWSRLAGRPMLYVGECAVATAAGPAWLQKIGQNGTKATAGMEFMTTGWANHNDAWVLRNSSSRTYMRKWLKAQFSK